MFELIFLGTAASVPSSDRGLPALVVVAGPERLLVDCGEGTLRQLMRSGLGFRGLHTVLLTHAHLDHVLGLAGLVATLALYRMPPIEIVGSAQTLAFAQAYLETTVGPGGEDAPYRLREAAPGLLRSEADWRLDAFPVTHRGTASLGYRFQGAAHAPLSRERLAALGVPEGPPRRILAEGQPVVLADGRQITPEEVREPSRPGVGVAIIGDAEATPPLVEPVRGADMLAIEATFLERDRALARARGHLTAGEAASLARDADVGELLLTHISARYRADEIIGEAAPLFPRVRVVADFDRIAVQSYAAART
jgi:ribonuclease Z